MNTQMEPTRSRPPMVRRAAAGLVLILAAIIAVKLVVGIVTAAFWTIVTVAVVVAVLWAIKQLVW
jgi:hypothetical protein